MRTTTQQDTYCIQADGKGPLRITLVWWDPPASLTSAKALVNDLDLTVRTADGLLLKVCFCVGGWMCRCRCGWVDV